MIRAPRRGDVAAHDFALSAGLLSAMVVDGHTVEQVARHYGFTLPRLRERLSDHLAACAAALGIEPPAVAIPEQETAQAVPAAAEAASLAPPVRIRERVRPAPSSAPDPTYSNRIRAVRMR